ncbi:MAG TPA: hypothetical protein VMI12_08195 [Puia sp.]|nr:hypothetical protein [Puia sp.]
MKENKIVYRCSQFSGMLLIIAALVKAISINNLVVGATTGDISKHYATSVLIDWSFSCMLLSLIGIWILFLARDLKNLQKRAWSQAVLIGLAFTLFGGGFWFRYPSSLHLPFFLLVGLLLLVPLLIYSRRFKQ